MVYDLDEASKVWHGLECSKWGIEMSDLSSPVLRINKSDMLGIIKDAVPLHGPFETLVPSSIRQDDDGEFMISFEVATDTN
jgi:hypothetical protein